MHMCIQHDRSIVVKVPPLMYYATAVFVPAALHFHRTAGHIPLTWRMPVCPAITEFAHVYESKVGLECSVIECCKSSAAHMLPRVS